MREVATLTFRNMAAPCVLVASCGDCNSQSHIPSSIVKRILGISELPDGKQILNGIIAYPWQVDTKYYTADVCLCTSQDRTIGNKVFAESVQAVVIHFDTQQTEALDGVKAWLPYLEELQPAIRLLTCNQCLATDTVSKDSCLHWCLDNDFELVELDPETENTDTEDDFPETVGIERIIEAIEAHMWPNMVMKEQPASRSSYMQEMMLEHPDPADDSPPHSLTNRTKDSEFVLSDNVTPSDSKQCGDVSLVDSRFLLAKPTRQGDAPSTELLQNVTQESEACWDTTASSQRLSNVTEEQSVNITCHDSSKRGDSQHVGDTGVVTHDSSVQPDSCQRKKPPSCQSLKTKPADKQTLDVTDTQTMRLFEALASDDVEDDSYEQLFERLRIMKEQANTLPDTQRKAYAEQVALSFLKAIGGDDEIDGLCESD